MLTIYSNQGYSQQMWYGSLGLTSCAVYLWLKRRSSRLFILPSIFLSALHPAWTFSATNGDCGYMMYDASLGIIIFISAMLLAQMSIYTYIEN